MRLIAHLSDLHFGKADAQVAEMLLADLDRHRPDLVLISGDLTQRARSSQFAEAKVFLSRLPAPALVVPGNHDLAPFFRPLSRLIRPRARFHAHLEHQPWPVWQDGELVAIGLDSTRRLRWTAGRLRQNHFDHVARVLAESPDGAAKVAFLHHPPPAAEPAIRYATLADHGIDLILTGHVHRAHVSVVSGTRTDASAILVQVSTACSTRLRGEANGYGLIRIDGRHLEITMQGWTSEGFKPRHHHVFAKLADGWQASAT